MFEKKFNWKIWFFILLFGATLLVAPRVIFLLVTNQMMDENGLPLHPLIKWLLFSMFFLVFSTYGAVVITLLKQVTVHKNTAFRVDEEGIHNTLVFVYLFAFVIVCKVKFIPWSAVCYIDNKDGVYIRVKRKQVTASFMGRLIIGILGYHFCYSFTTKKLSPSEIDMISSYCATQANCRATDEISRLSDIF